MDFPSLDQTGLSPNGPPGDASNSLSRAVRLSYNMSLRLSRVCAAIYLPVGQARGVQRPVVPGRVVTLPAVKSNACRLHEAAIGKVGPLSPKTSSVADVQFGAPCQPGSGMASTGIDPSGDTMRILLRPFSPVLQPMNATRRPSGDHFGNAPA